MMSNARTIGLAALATLATQQAPAQVRVVDGPFDLTIEAYLNATAALAETSASAALHSLDGFADGAVRLYGYLQWARAEGDATRVGNDRLLAGEVGLAYRFTERFRLFGALYGFAFDDEGGHGAGDRRRGAVLLTGARLTL